jgi:hypothetical protein
MAGPSTPPPPTGPIADGSPPPIFGRHRDGSWVGGAILIGIGLAFLAGQLIPHAGDYIVLAIGLTFLAAFVVTREYGFLVPGGIVTGVGTGIVFASNLSAVEGGSLFMLSLGFGFIAIWVIGLVFRVRENHPWPLIPGIILGGIGAASLAGTRYAEIGRYGWPIALIALGAILLVRGWVRRPGG